MYSAVDGYLGHRTEIPFTLSLNTEHTIEVSQRKIEGKVVYLFKDDIFIKHCFS